MNAYIGIFGSVGAKIGKRLDMTISEKPVILCESSVSVQLVIDGGKLYNYG